MTICFLTSAHRATDTRIFEQEAKSLVQKGLPVTIIGLHDEETQLSGIRIFPIKKSEHIIFDFFSVSKQVFVEAIKSRSKIFHFHDPELLPIGALLKLNGNTVIYDVHEDYEQKLITRLRGPHWLKKLSSKVWWGFEKSVSRLFDIIVAADQHVCDKFAPHPRMVIPNVPNESFWNSGERTRSDDHEFRVLYVGTITRDRGIIETIKALDHVTNDCVTLHIVGSTKDTELIQLFNQHKKVFWHGRVEWNNLPGILKSSDAGIVLLQPVPAYLYYPGENIVKLWEYLSVGLPVIISNLPKLQKLCDDLMFGLAVDPTNPRKIAEAIDYLIDHPDQRELFSYHGKNIVLREYNAEVKMKPLIDFYSSLSTIDKGLNRFL
jgi:glycosyltransferase involved in cell wall biosynthesis